MYTREFHKSAQALTNIFFVMQKLSERQIETLTGLKEIHPAMNFSNATNQCCYAGCEKGVPSLGYIRSSYRE